MPRKAHKYHYLYKTTNMINGRYYVGMHSTSNLEDGYLGSGKKLRHALNKYGKENFSKEILSYYENREELIKGEIEMITETLINDVNCMNIMLGGRGGFISDEQQKYRSICGGNALSLKLKNDKIFLEKFILMVSNRMKQFHILGKINYNTFDGKKHKESTKLIMSEKAKLRTKGESNGSFGTCWINKEGKNKKIKKEDLENYLKDNWNKGRKMK